MSPRDAGSGRETSGAAGEMLDAETPEAESGSEPEEDAQADPSDEAGSEELDAGDDPEADADTEPTDGGDEGDAEADADAGPPAAAVADVGTDCSIPLAAACTGRNSTQKLVCLGGTWTFNGSCDGATRCEASLVTGQGTCQAIDPLCVGKRPGEAVCSGSARLRCNADLLHTAADACGQNAHCQPGESAECVCDSGYARDGNGACVDIVDCVAGTCAGGTCADLTNRFECTCGPGYVVNETKTACNDIVDCAANICGVGGTCVEMVGGYQCTCAAGYLPTADQHGCVVACSAPNSVTNCQFGSCVDGPSGYTCECPPEYCFPDGAPGAQYCNCPCIFGCSIS